jgi:transposase
LKTLPCLVCICLAAINIERSQCIWKHGYNGNRYVIQNFHLKGLSPTNIKHELDSTLGESAPSFITIKYWVAEFKRGRSSCQDEHRSGRPKDVTTPEMVKKIHS